MMNIPQVKRVAERPTSETTLSDKVVNVQYKLLKAQSKTRVAMSENKLLLQKIAELRRDWREDVRDTGGLECNSLLCKCMLHLIAGPWDHASRHTSYAS